MAFATPRKNSRVTDNSWHRFNSIPYNLSYNIEVFFSILEKKIARMVVPIFGQKWFLVSGSGYLRAVLRVAVGSSFFTVSALFKPAKCLRRLKGKCTSSTDGSERAAET